MYQQESLHKKDALAKRSTLQSNNLFFLEEVSVRFENIEALKSVQLSIDRGEIIFVTGASGAGKSTLLRVLSGEVSPTFGRYRRRENIFISQVFQDLRLLGNETIEQNLLMTYDSNLYKTYKEFKHDLDELCRFLGFSDRLQARVCEANGGLKQKVALVRALLSRPDVLLADELTSSLDWENAKRIFEMLNLYNHKRGLTVIWASHNGELLKKFTGRIIHLDNGRLVYTGHACFM